MIITIIYNSPKVLHNNPTHKSDQNLKTQNYSSKPNIKDGGNSKKKKNNKTKQNKTTKKQKTNNKNKTSRTHKENPNKVISCLEDKNTETNL
jgi:hypothetical protein